MCHHQISGTMTLKPSWTMFLAWPHGQDKVRVYNSLMYAWFLVRVRYDDHIHILMSLKLRLLCVYFLHVIPICCMRTGLKPLKPRAECWFDYSLIGAPRRNVGSVFPTLWYWCIQFYTLFRRCDISHAQQVSDDQVFGLPDFCFQLLSLFLLGLVWVFFGIFYPIS